LTIGVLLLASSVVLVWLLVFHRRNAENSDISSVEIPTTLVPAAPADWEPGENFEHDFINPMTLKRGELDGLGDESDAFENELNGPTFE
jgi:hypothetical protein